MLSNDNNNFGSGNNVVPHTESAVNTAMSLSVQVAPRPLPVLDSRTKCAEHLATKQGAEIKIVTPTENGHPVSDPRVYRLKTCFQVVARTSDFWNEESAKGRTKTFDCFGSTSVLTKKEHNEATRVSSSQRVLQREVCLARLLRLPFQVCTCALKMRIQHTTKDVEGISVQHKTMCFETKQLTVKHTTTK